MLHGLTTLVCLEPSSTHIIVLALSDILRTGCRVREFQ